MSMEKYDIITLIKSKTAHAWEQMIECEEVLGLGDISTKRERAKWGAYSDLLEEVTGHAHYYVNGEMVPEYML